MNAYSFAGMVSFKLQNNICKVGTFIVSIWQMVKLKLREVKKFLIQGIQEMADTCMNSL